MATATNVTVIPAKPQTANNRSQYKQLRVAAYCRVSTEQEEQQNSYQVQIEYYTDLINSKKEWTLAGIFADEGISGTQTKKRTEFNRMIRMCKQKKIDLILTKSISRFARNTVDCLEYVRILKELGIGVIFEKESINTLTMTSEFMIALYGSFAQAESESISKNVSLGVQMAMREGKVRYSYKRWLGYCKGEDGKPVIIPEEAEMIRKVYELFLDGHSMASVAEMMMIHPTDKIEWHRETIRRILTNEKYTGDCLLQKTFTADCITHKAVKNNGERAMYLVSDCHPAIIDRDTFNLVQQELARRTSKRKVSTNTITEQGKYSSKYALTDLMICGECGTPYRRVNRSKPYMIVLLGERYGYIADEAIIHNVAAQKDLRLEDERISATQLEIEYGALCEAAKNNNVFFYIRRMNCTGDSVYGPESDEAKSKLDSLKQRIIDNAGEKVRCYDAYLENEKPNPEYLQKLGEDIITDIAQLIKEKYSYIAELNHFQKDNLLQWNYLKEKQGAFLARRDLADSIVEKLQTDGTCLGITGGTGTGKSTLFAEILKKCRDDGYTVFPFFCGSTEKTTSASEILEMLVYLLEEMLDQVHLCDSVIADDQLSDITSKKDKNEIYRNRLIELSYLLPESGHELIVAVDAVDQMCADSLRNSFMFLPENGKNIRILLTADDRRILPENCEIITLSELSADEKRKVIKRILQLSGKELPEKTIHAILSKKSTGNPLYLYLLVQRLMLLQEKDYQIIYKADSAGEAIQNRLCELIKTTPDDIEKITYQLLEMIESVLPSSVRIAAESLAVSRYGLRESDIEHIYKIHGEAFSPLDLVIFMNYFSELSFIRNDGRIDFLHKCVRNAILAHINDESTVHYDIVNVLDKLPTDDSVKVNEFQYHTICLGLMKTYIQYISELTKRRDIDSISINARDSRADPHHRQTQAQKLHRLAGCRCDEASGSDY